MNALNAEFLHVKIAFRIVTENKLSNTCKQDQIENRFKMVDRCIAIAYDDRMVVHWSHSNEMTYM